MEEMEIPNYKIDSIFLHLALFSQVCNDCPNEIHYLDKIS